MENIHHTYSDTLESLKSAHQLRSLKKVDTRTGKTILYKGKYCLNLSSNDYLGLAGDADLCNKFYASIQNAGQSGNLEEKKLINAYGLGSSSSRLLTGNSSLYETLEDKICQWYDAKAALIFNSGYHANLGIIPALAGKNDLIISDSLNHASIIDGIRLSKAQCQVFPHNDMARLKTLLEQKRADFDNVLIITESLFSMDGDRADIKALVDLKTRYHCLLYIDEAHSAGVYGTEGQGLCYEAGLSNKVDILLGTMGKALASHGAYIVTSPVLKSFLINSARSLIFSTALPPVAISWNLFILEHMPLFKERRNKLLTVSEKFKESLLKQNLTITGDSHIIPVITNSNEKTVQISDMLIEKGFLAFPIRPPTVPKNNSRIRFSITSDMEVEDIDQISSLIKAHI